MERSINIVHEVTSYKKRIIYYIQLFIVIVSVFGLFYFFNKNNNIQDFGSFILIIFLTFGCLIFIKILKTKLYLADFISDSENVNLVYFNGSKEEKLEIKIETLEVKIKNTTSRAGFNFEIVLYSNDLKFTLNKDFDWTFSEMKQVFEYVRFHNNIPFTEKEKDLLTIITDYIKRVPF